jgi:hypothetical protein
MEIKDIICMDEQMRRRFVPMWDNKMGQMLSLADF